MGGFIFASGPTGLTVYGQLVSVAASTVANGAALEAYNQGHWANYVNSMPEQAGSGRYGLSVPGYLPAGRYLLNSFIQGGGSPAAGDTSLDITYFDWDGANVIYLGSALNVGQINGSSTAAARLAVSAAQFVIGAAAAGTLSTSQMTTNLGASVANIYAGRVLYFTSGVNAGLAVLITAYAVTGGRLTFVGFNNQPAPSAPSAADAFIII